jgi:hypothetical protein
MNISQAFFMLSMVSFSVIYGARRISAHFRIKSLNGTDNI